MTFAEEMYKLAMENKYKNIHYSIIDAIKTESKEGNTNVVFDEANDNFMYVLIMKNKEELEENGFKVEEGYKIECWTQERIKTIAIDWNKGDDINE